MNAWLTTSLLALAVCCGINLADTARRVPPPPRIAPAAPANNALRHEFRFAPVLAALRAHGVRGPVGYLSDLPPEAMRGNTAAMEQYFLSQFVLAPWILDADASRGAWAVTNLQRAPPAGRLPAGYEVVQDFGGGVLLLRRTGP